MQEKNNSGSFNGKINEEITQAVEVIYQFIDQVTGQPPTQAEIATALKRYFVLNEIKDHIIMARSKNTIQNQAHK